MRRIRVIPVLLISDGKLVKTKKFENPVYVGDPINAIRIFNDKGVDELAVCDISKHRRRRGPDMELMEKMASEAFMPLAYAGGVSSLEQGDALIKAGFEKLAINTSLVENEGLLPQLAERFGSQSVIASVDYKKRFLGGIQQYVNSGSVRIKADFMGSVKRWVELGAGEIWLNSIEREATYAGYDLDTIATVSDSVAVPVVSLGGAGNADDMKAAIGAGASAVAAGAMFVFQRPHNAVLISYLKEEIFV